MDFLRKDVDTTVFILYIYSARLGQMGEREKKGEKKRETGGEEEPKLTTHERELANTVRKYLNAEAQSSPNKRRSTYHAAAATTASCTSTPCSSFLCNRCVTCVSVEVLKL
jgi:hypothetical protein